MISFAVIIVFSPCSLLNMDMKSVHRVWYHDLRVWPSPDVKYGNNITNCFVDVPF